MGCFVKAWCLITVSSALLLLYFNFSTNEFIIIHRAYLFNVSESVNKTKRKETKKLILNYRDSGWFDMKQGGFTNCTYSNCLVTKDINFFNKSDIVMFRYDWGMTNILPKMKTLRPPEQRWLGFSLENPYNTPTIPENTFEIFVTYKRDSDIFYPYGSYRELSKHEERPDKNINYALGRTKKIAWLVSHCVSIREELVHKLESYGIDVHVGGGCAAHFKHKLTCQQRNCAAELQEFKFYLSAENNLCDEYITEKYWRIPLENNLVPIVFSGANYSNELLAIPGSFINVFNFSSVRTLAEYINKVDQDDSLYNSYFKWKQRYTFNNMDWPTTFYCDLCQHAHINPPKKIKSSMKTYFSPDTNCKKHETYFREFLKYT